MKSLFPSAIWTSLALLLSSPSLWSAEPDALPLPAGKGSWVNVHFQASPESTPGKMLIAELLVTDSTGEMPINSIAIEASPHFTKNSPPTLSPSGHSVEFKSQKGTHPVFVPADADALVLEAILFGVADRKLVLHYGITASELSDSNSPQTLQKRIEVDHANRAEFARVRIPILRIESESE